MQADEQKKQDSVNENLAFIQSADDLRAVNKLLTESMAQQKVQALIKGDNLATVCQVVTELAVRGHGEDEKIRMLAAAVLGRLSAVARGRNNIVFARLDELFDKYPVGIDGLSDGDEKYYAALTISRLKKPWTINYCSEQSVVTDTAERARSVLIGKVLNESGDLTSFWQKSRESFEALHSIASDETRYKRIRRISSAANDAIKNWDSDVGVDPGLALSDWLSDLVRSSKSNAEVQVLSDVLDDALSMLLRVIELRFSNALMASTYSVLDRARTAFGRQLWPKVIGQSKNIEKVKVCLKEAALVLARQGRTDKEVMDMLCSAYHSRAQVRPAIAAHFSTAHELDSDVREWWERAGAVKESYRKVEHKLGNSEDQQIGTLLINVEASKTVMEKLERAVVPLLEISDPPLAETVKKAAGSYSEIALAARQLAGMRRLQHMDLKDEVLEYNPLQQDMLGGHQLGVRSVKVERDGIQKDFGGKIKVLVKPRVVPADR